MKIYLAIQQSGYPESKGNICKIIASKDEKEIEKAVEELETSWHSADQFEIEIKDE